MKLDFKKSAVLAALGLAVAQAGCSRDHIEAINLANEGDRGVAVNVEGAIQKYEQAVKLDPTSHLLLWKLAKAYEKKEDWDKLASTLSRAVQIAPDFANYWSKQGYALLKQAEAGNPDSYEAAKKPLQECIAKDPNFAECYFDLAVASLWTDDEQAAATNYTKAIEKDSSKSYYYPELAELYITFRLYEEAEKVLAEGTRIIQPSETNNSKLYAMHILMSQCAQARGDLSAQLAAAEKAEEIDGKNHPEIAFILGSTYAVTKPPQKEKATRLLEAFTKRACRGKDANKFKEQCETTSSLIQRLGG